LKLIDEICIFCRCLFCSVPKNKRRKNNNRRTDGRDGRGRGDYFEDGSPVAGSSRQHRDVRYTDMAPK
jgi:hypothetical protein